MARALYVYILSNASKCLYVGVTNNVYRRWVEHCGSERGSQFCKRYHITRIVYIEQVSPPMAAIRREKQIKKWERARRVELVESMNPTWTDLAVEWGWRPPAASTVGMTRVVASKRGEEDH